MSRPPKYPWHEWLDPATWPRSLASGRDFTISAENMRIQVLNQARSRGLEVSTMIRTSETGRRWLRIAAPGTRLVSQYPWKDWLRRGVTVVLQRGVDFDLEPLKLQQKAHEIAHSEKFNLRIWSRRTADTVTITCWRGSGASPDGRQDGTMEVAA